MWTYRTLVRIFPGIANVVGGELDGLLIERRQELFGKGDFRHDVLLEGGVQGSVEVGIQFGGGDVVDARKVGWK